MTDINLAELHHWIYVRYSRVARDKRRPVREREIWEFITHTWGETNPTRIQDIIKELEAKALMHRGNFAGDWIPNAPKSEPKGRCSECGHILY